MKKALAIGVLTIFLASCGMTGGPNQTGGTLLGAGAGALVGSQIGGGSGRIVATALGTLGGAAAGGYIGKQMDKENSNGS
jgi:uncharacterized protein YcfJ